MELEDNSVSRSFFQFPALFFMKDRLRPDEKAHLDDFGYVLLKGVLAQKDLQVIKSRLDQIKAEEGPRLGEFGRSHYREMLLEKKSRVRLWLFDCQFRIWKVILNSIFVVFPVTRKIVYAFGKGLHQSREGSLRREICQMMITILEQFDQKDERICDLVNKGNVFSLIYRNSKVLDAVRHVIGDQFKLSSLNVRSPKRGNLTQKLHVDYPWAVAPGDYFACNALWLLDDMNLENGPTRVVPGTHRKASLPKDEMDDPRHPHPEEKLIVANAGDVIFLNSHIWHGGTSNRSGESRAIIQSYFVHKAHPSQQQQRQQLRDNTRSFLTAEDLRVLDII